jgi:protein SCO1/2
MQKKSRSPLLFVIGLTILMVVAVGGRLMSLKDDHAGAAAIGGPFTLVDQDGRTVTDADFRGRAMLVYFGYTFCPDVCPTELGVMAAALDKLSPEQRAKVRPIFVTIDPERDTPKVMKDYVANFAPDLIGLTGSPEQVAAAAKAYKVYAAKAKGGTADSYTMDHSSIVYLMGPDGRFVGHFPGGTKPEDMAAGILKLVK